MPVNSAAPGIASTIAASMLSTRSNRSAVLQSLSRSLSRKKSQLAVTRVFGNVQSCPVYHRLFGYKEGQGRFFRVEVHAVEHHRRQGYWVEEEVSGTVPELFIDVNRIDNAYYLDIEPTRVPDRRRHYDRVPHLEVEYEGRPSAYSGFHHKTLRPCADDVLRRRAFEIVDVIIQVRDAVEVPARD